MKKIIIALLITNVAISINAQIGVNTLGSGGNQGTVVYKGSATTTTIHVVPSTNYDYCFYSENYSYYSAGVKAEVNSAAINNPSSPTVSVSGTTATLGWTKNAAANDVMIVRYAKGASVTAPTQGTTYIAGNSIGSGTVVYHGNETSTTNAITAGMNMIITFIPKTRVIIVQAK